jgi:hypothetical protein
MQMHTVVTQVKPKGGLTANLSLYINTCETKGRIHIPMYTNGYMKRNWSCLRIFSRVRSVSETARVCPRELTSRSWDTGVVLPVESGWWRKISWILTIEGLVVGEWLMSGEKRRTNVSCHEVSREREG